jgi:hypothetical protein
MLTMMLALILIYLFSLLGFIFFRDDFLNHIQARLFSSYRYRRTHHMLKTTILTRMSKLSSVHLLLLFKNFKESNRFILFPIFLATTTIPTIVNNSYCTKDNCTNDTVTGHIRQGSTILPEESIPEEVERSCDTLFMCIVTTLNKGLRNGGGIGDVLRQPSSQVSS